MNWISVMGFGVIGVSLRFAIDSWIAKWAFSFPVGTLLINVIGCLLAGFIFNYGIRQNIILDPIRIGIVVGFCGGFTTFSGFGLQFLQLINSGKILEAATYGIGSPILCILATGIGFWLSRIT